jgi:acyl-CoA synthetase (AMP-forming)/AMP-acid ligase II
MALTLKTSIKGAAASTAIIVPSKPAPLTATYAQLLAAVSALQSKLAALGISTAAPVSLALGNSYEFVVSFLAVAWQRGIAAPLNPAYKQDEFEFYIDDVGSALVLVPRGAVDAGSPAVRAARRFGAAVAECYWDGSRGEVVLDVRDRGQLKGRAPVQEPQPDDVALVLHTRYGTPTPLPPLFAFLVSLYLPQGTLVERRLGPKLCPLPTGISHERCVRLHYRPLSSPNTGIPWHW